jgi:hypothetical protein
LFESLKTDTSREILHLYGPFTLGVFEGLGEVLKALPHLTNLCLSYYPESNIDSVEALGDTLVHAPKLKTLRIVHLIVGAGGTAAFVKGLRCLPQLQTLDLPFSQFGTEGINVLVEAFPSLPLTTLNLGWSVLGDSGVEALARGLRFLSLLQALDLSNNGISDSGAKALAAVIPSLPHLATLDVHYNIIENEGARALTGAVVTHAPGLNLIIRANLFDRKSDLRSVEGPPAIEGAPKGSSMYDWGRDGFGPRSLAGDWSWR